MGLIATTMELGDWGLALIGLGPRYYFDLTLAYDIEESLIKLALDRSPDAVY